MKELDLFKAADLLRTKKELIHAAKYPYDSDYTHVTPHKTPIYMRVSVLKEMLAKEIADVDKRLKALTVTELSK